MLNVNDNGEFGSRLQKMREQGNVTQKEMAEACALSKNYISALERGMNKCNVQTLVGYCNKLRITPNELLDYGDPDIIVDLKTKLSEMDKQTQQRILKMILAAFD